MAGRAGTPRSGSASAARNRLLPEGRVAGPMPWVIAIMMFLTVLAVATGLALHLGTRALSVELADRATIQVIDANPETRRRTVSRIVETLRGAPGVRSVRPVEEKRLAEQLRPWLGADMDSADLPIPALVDIEMTAGQRQGTETLSRIVRRIAPGTRVEPHAAFLGPFAGLVGTLTLLAALLVVLMTVATGAIVVLAARAAHESHRGTIEILHLMGATDVQIARLFQRRIALDALLGGVTGFLMAIAVLLLLGQRLAATGSDLMGTASLPPWGWALLALAPVLGVALAMLTARFTVLRALGRTL